jgi:hypothetical protein
MMNKSLQDLVRHHLPPQLEEAKVQRVVDYSLRLLGARIQPL